MGKAPLNTQTPADEDGGDPRLLLIGHGLSDVSGLAQRIGGLEIAGTAGSVRPCPDPADIPEPRPGRDPMLFVYVGAVDAMMAAMAQGRPPSEMLAAWQAEIGPFLAAFRKRRKYAAMIARKVLLGDPAAAGAAFAARRDTAIAITLTPGAAAAPPAPSDLHNLLAQRQLYQVPQARSLDAELAASALPVGDLAMAGEPAPDRVFAAWHEMRRSLEAAETDRQTAADRARKAAEKTTQKATEKTDVARKAAAAAEARAETLDAALKQARDRLESTRTARRDAETAHRREIAALQEERALFEAQTGEQSAELFQRLQIETMLRDSTTDLRARLAQSDAARAALQERLTTLEAEHSALQSERDRLSALQRAMQADMDSQRGALEHSRTEVARQGGLAQSLERQKTEQIATLLQQADRQARDSAQVLDGYDRRMATLEAALAQNLRYTDHLARALSEAEAEVTALRASTSWRVTGPLRATSRTIRGLSPRER